MPSSVPTDQAPRPGFPGARRWHRWLGYLLLIPLLYVSITGLLLNHTDDLDLDSRHATSPWILDRYGMNLSGEPVSFESGNFIASSWSDSLFLNGRSLEATGDLVGILTSESTIGLVCPDVVHLFSAEGELVESLDELLLPDSPIVAAAALRTIRTEDGRLWQFTDDFLEINEITKEGASPSWQSRVPTPEKLQTRMQESYRGPGMTWSRVLLDLHSGRFFGSLGKWIIDACAILFMILAITGLRLAFRNRRNRNSLRKTK